MLSAVAARVTISKACVVAAALSLAAFAPIAAAAFQAGMSVEQIEAEAKIQLAAGATLGQIAQRALAAG
ncbi:MAG TPA: hypothetical protein VLD39_15595, partial [Gammaproteobacteria bacterium]|nr:hypothetical protein [Gammaproteobacteria bacterium]